MAYRQIAWCYSLAMSLRKFDPLDGMDEFLDRADMEELSKHQNKPMALVNLNSRELSDFRDKGKLDAYSQVHISDTLVRLVESQGKAERIKSTTFPVTYRLFLHFVIYLFVIVLSISLVEFEGYFEIPLLLFISSVFFLLERSAYHMQDPFENRPTDTAMTTISRTIEINIRQLLKEDKVPESFPPGLFFAL